MAKIFNPDRYGFVVVGDKLVVMDRADRDMPTAEWANKVLGIDQGDLTISTRGYITPDRIQFFTNDYTTDTGVDADMVAEAYQAYTRLYSCGLDDAMDVPVFNGVKAGKVGETWPPYLVWMRGEKRWMVA